jgi:hypothetical protein
MPTTVLQKNTATTGQLSFLDIITWSCPQMAVIEISLCNSEGPTV